MTRDIESVTTRNNIYYLEGRAARSVEVEAAEAEARKWRRLHASASKALFISSSILTLCIIALIVFVIQAWPKGCK